jgi:hypothetical protein
VLNGYRWVHFTCPYQGLGVPKHRHSINEGKGFRREIVMEYPCPKEKAMLRRIAFRRKVQIAIRIGDLVILIGILV